MSDANAKSRFDSFPQSEEVGLSSAGLERAYGLLERAVVEGSLMGAAIQVSRQGIALKPRCFGRRELNPDGASVEPDTIFLVASVTKPVTAAAAMLLVERGKLCLDEPVSSIIPEFGKKGKERVLVRHLFTHTSGLPDQLPENQQLRAQHAPLKEFIRRICEVELLFPPGTNVSYQSCGLAMLSEIVERIEGVPLREFMRRELFEPLGMKDTSLGAQQDRVERISKVKIPAGAFQYGSTETDWNWNSQYWWNFGAPWGGMFTTVEDMTVFCQMFLNGGRFGEVQILSPTTVAAMTINQIAAMPNITEEVKLTNRWGLGWRLRSLNNSGFGDLVSEAAYGHSGATGTLVWLDPQLQLTCVIFTNDPQGANRLRPLVSNAVAGSVTNI
ncbi:MAG: serine hydrolase domain-containing protein [Candidatus Poribacteria bacterium]